MSLPQPIEGVPHTSAWTGMQRNYCASHSLLVIITSLLACPECIVVNLHSDDAAWC